MKLRCVVERITYQNPDTGYSILKTKVKDYADLVTVVGNLLDVVVGSVLLLEGQWKVDATLVTQAHWTLTVVGFQTVVQRAADDEGVVGTHIPARPHARLYL